jgi:hypothetical protein
MVQYSINKHTRYAVYIIIFFVAGFTKELITPALTTLHLSTRAGAEGITIAALIAGILFLFDKVIWRWLAGWGFPIVPDFSGKWFGYIKNRSFFQEHPEGQFNRIEDPPIPVEVTIEQTFMEFGIWLRTRRVDQHSFEASLAVKDSGCTMASIDISSTFRPKLIYTFKEGNLQGASQLVLQQEDTYTILGGSYYSSYPRSAEIELVRSFNRHSLFYCAQLRVLNTEDNRPYVGIFLDRRDVSKFDIEFQSLVGPEEYSKLSTSRWGRDGDRLHMTVINPYEYEALQKAGSAADLQQLTKESIWIELIALGKQQQPPAVIYYIIGESLWGQQLRRRFHLPKTDLHITLGFTPHDIHGVNKGIETRINSGWPSLFRPSFARAGR